MSPIADLHAAVAAAAATLAGDAEIPAATLERPKRAGFGDYSTNAAMLLAPLLGEPPRAIAERLAADLRERLAGALERVEVAGPGFLNLFLSDEWHRAALAHVLELGEGFGGGIAAEPLAIDLEFVSANPTGPLHVGHARNAAYGDALGRILAFAGHRVRREFYVNDFGSQVRRFAESVRARARGEEVPPDGYRGDYVRELAREIGGSAELELEPLGREAVARMLARARDSLRGFGVLDFDIWFSERTLHEGDPSPVAHAFAVLEQQGRTYSADGALWLRTTDFGDDKDRVLVRSGGEHTYFASDIAYHQLKRERGDQLLVDVWGADHHGYLKRMQAAFEALGGEPGQLELLIMQFVNLVGGASMSKRKGEFVTLDELVEEIGRDAARWFLLARSHDTTIELDLELARRESSENPVYYVQYAHARIASLLAKAGREQDAAAPAALAESLHPAERELVRALLVFPEEVALAAERRAPHRIAAFALELAQQFTAFYRDCRVVGAEPAGVEELRLALSLATGRTIARALDLLGVGAPREM